MTFNGRGSIQALTYYTNILESIGCIIIIRFTSHSATMDTYLTLLISVKTESFDFHSCSGTKHINHHYTLSASRCNSAERYRKSSCKTSPSELNVCIFHIQISMLVSFHIHSDVFYDFDKRYLTDNF